MTTAPRRSPRITRHAAPRSFFLTFTEEKYKHFFYKIMKIKPLDTKKTNKGFLKMYYFKQKYIKGYSDLNFANFCSF